MAKTYQEAWDELVMKCQYDTGGMNITEFQKSLIVWADSWVRTAQQSVRHTEIESSEEECGCLMCAIRRGDFVVPSPADNASR